jgi:hypothetical protein
VTEIFELGVFWVIAGKWLKSNELAAKKFSGYYLVACDIKPQGD